MPLKPLYLHNKMYFPNNIKNIFKNRLKQSNLTFTK